MSLPNIETTRLLLREIKRSDAKAIFDYSWRDDVGPYAGWMPHTTIKDTKRYIEYALNKPKENQPGVFSVLLKETNTLVGTIELHGYQPNFKAHIGMVCHPKHQQKGYMYEASMAVMIYGFEHLHLRRISYAHFPNNKASEKLRDKLGFTYEGVLRKYYRRYDRTITDFVMSSFTDIDYAKAHSKIFAPFKTTVTIT